ncbi:hypothetical protein EVA_11684 [gut metagenome]|uniref:Uncharacterized protein n=1 Tax=gut metagenome TaxID=749906 RepID=J9G053_9ZZZZ
MSTYILPHHTHPSLSCVRADGRHYLHPHLPHPDHQPNLDQDSPWS